MELCELKSTSWRLNLKFVREKKRNRKANIEIGNDV